MDWIGSLGFSPEIVGDGGSGWIPPEHRTAVMTALHNEVIGAAPMFAEVNTLDDLPDSCVYAALQKSKLGKLRKRLYQRSGSCVGAGAAKAYQDAQAGDIIARGDAEELECPFPWATYGIGRMLGGMRGTGDGSFGSAQAKAIETWGMLRQAGVAILDQLPKPEELQEGNEEAWLTWSAAIERQWSHPSNWPIKEALLKELAAEAQIQSVARVRSTDELAKAASQMYGITLASNYGTRTETVKSGFLIWAGDGSWAHQMSAGGYHTHPDLGRIWLIDNQWWRNAHKVCPYLSALGVRGSGWIPDRDMARIISSGEVFVHSNTKGFPARKISWGGLGVL